MLNSRIPVAFLKGTLGLCLAVLLIAPVAVLYSGPDHRIGDPTQTRQPIQRMGGEAEKPAWWIESMVSWLEKNQRTYHSRGKDFWPAEMGKRHMGQVDLSENRSPFVIHLPGKGSFNVKKGAPRVPEGMRKDHRGPVRQHGDYFIAQPSVRFLLGKSAKDVRKMMADLGVTVVGTVPNNAYLLRVKGNKARQQLLNSTDFQFVGAYHPAYKIDHRVGAQKLLSPDRASSNTLNLTVRLHKGEPSRRVKGEIARLGGKVKHVQQFNGRRILSVDIDKKNVFKLAKLDPVYLIQEKRDQVTMMNMSSMQVEMGRFLDPRLNGGFVRPFHNDGIDGGGVYAEDPNIIAGCGPFDPATGTVDPNCFVIQPQFLGLIDNGISLDTAPLAHSQNSSCIGGASCGTANQITNVGDTHRKVEMYVRSKDLDNDGIDPNSPDPVIDANNPWLGAPYWDDQTAEGDALSCDSVSSGGATHGHFVATTMMGNSTNGQFGLGVTWDDNWISNQFFTFFNDSNEVNLPADGQASGARLLFIDAQGTGVPNGGPPPCAANTHSDVNTGAAVIDDVVALAYRPDISAGTSLHARGAKVIALPFGSTTDFDDNVYNGHNTYLGEAEDLDAFLWNNRRVFIAVASGNDGAFPNSGADRDPFVDFVDPNVGFTAADIQIQDMASGKNTVVVGSNYMSTVNRDLSPTDATEFILNFSSKGPSTVASLRMAPTFVAPGFEATSGVFSWEGQWRADFGDSHMTLQSYDDEQDDAEGVEAVRHHGRSGTSVSTGNIAGAAGQIREYFAEGYYPGGGRNLSQSVTDVSGPLVKAVMAASTDFATSGPLIASCTSRPCIEQGWGKVELANALPLLTYQQTRRSADRGNQAFDPTTPPALMVVDELWAGTTDPNGVPRFGVISPGQTIEYKMDVYHGGASFRAALAWYDVEGELLVNDLDLEVLDGDYDRSPRWDTWYGIPTPGSGECNTSAWGGFPSGCGHCTIADLANPDTAYFDPTGFNPYVRRFVGNQMATAGQHASVAECGFGACDFDTHLGDGICDPNPGDGTGVCDPDPNSGTYLTCTAGDPNKIGDPCDDGDPNSPAPVDEDCDGVNANYLTCTAGDPNLAGAACDEVSAGDPNGSATTPVDSFCDSLNPNYLTCASGDTGASCSANADCSTGLDPNAPSSQWDRSNGLELVHIYNNQTYGIIGGNTTGMMSEGYYKVLVHWQHTTGNEVGAPNVPCVVPASGSGSLTGTAASGNDVLLTTSDGMEYIGSGVDDPNTVGTDEAQCDTTAGGTDLQLVASGDIGQPFALVVAGPVAVNGQSASTVSFNQEYYDCSDTTLSVTVTESDISQFTNTGPMEAGTKIEVLDAGGNVVDTEEGFGFAPIGTPNGFSNWRVMANRSADTPVQNVGPLGRSPVNHNGMIEVEDGWSLRATYIDPNDPTDVATTTARIECEPDITPGFTALAQENFKQKFIGGGCDLGRTINLRGDFNMDAGETVQYQVHFNNHSGHALDGLRATLSCSNDAAATPANDPCQYLTILNPVDNLGFVPFGRESAATWNIKVDEGVTALATADRVVFLDVDFTTTNTDSGGTITSQGFRFREALQADNEIFFYSSDYPAGGKKFIDVNTNGLVDRAEFGNGGRGERREIRTYQTWAATPNADLLTACGGGSCIPFNFDANDGGFTTFLAADSKPASLNPATNGWFWGTGGACGWQTQGPGPSFPKGIWHAGVGPIGDVGAGCGQYALPTDGSDGDFNNFASFMLFSPVFKKMNAGTDARGFEFDARLEHISWNANEDLADGAAGIALQIDMDVYDPNNPVPGEDHLPLVLGDSYSYRNDFTGQAQWVNRFGPKTNAANNARRFGPYYDPDGIFANGDEVGIATPLASYGAEFLERPLMPFPATDADGDPNNGFTSDERISNGTNCPPVRVGEPCRKAGFTTPEGPVRNIFVETSGSYEDFLGASGDRFQFEFNWLLSETQGGATASGYGMDDVLFEWSEQHPGDQPTYAGGDCTLNNIYPDNPSVTCDPDDPNDAGSGTCNGGARNGLFCNPGTTSSDPNLANHDDCRDVVTEGECSTGTCTLGLIGRSCSEDNDCDLGRCVGGNTELGCLADADCDLATNDCDAIPFRIAPTSSVGSNYAARQCATINLNREFTFDCVGAMTVTVHDTTPDVVSTVAGTCTSNVCTAGHVGDGCVSSSDCDVRQIQVNARTPNAGDPLGEFYVIEETASGSALFMGDVPYSSLNKLPGTLYVDSNPGENVNIFVSYADPECDGDLDGQTGENDFADIDGDGVPNFGANSVAQDQDPNRNYVTGGPISDDDNCFVPGGPTDVYNPAGVAQMDMNLDGVIDPNDCNVDTAHNASGQCDWDNDGIGDSCDNCPWVANNTQTDTDNDGIGELCEVLDMDGDGVQNISDNCPSIYNPSQAATGSGNRFARGQLCDATNDVDGDLIVENVDNCPTEQIVEDPNGGFLPYVGCSGTDFTGCYNPDQRDTDQDGVGDLCDDEDFDADGIINSVDNCVTVYNPADPAFLVQADSDGDGFGDDQANTDSVGKCQGGPTPGAVCTPAGTGAGCGTGGFCVPTADEYCDFDSDDDNSNGTPDDLIQFTTEIVCAWAPSHFGAPAAEIAAVALAGVGLADDGTSDFLCVGGDPDPTNNPLTPEFCRDPNNPSSMDPNGVFTPGLILTEAGPRAATWNTSGTAADTACDTVGYCVASVCANSGATQGNACVNHSDCDVVGDGECEPVPDGIVDPGEVTQVSLSLANSTLNQEGRGRTLTNVEIGLQTASTTVGCVTEPLAFVGTLPAGSTVVATGLSFVLDPNTAVSTTTKDAEAQFSVNIVADEIQGNAIPQTFKLVGDSDQVIFPRIAASCSGGALDVSHDADGILCEDFDTDRNGNGSAGDFSRLPLPTLPNPSDLLYAQGDPNDDIIGYTQDGGETPFGVAGLICDADLPWPRSQVDCHPVPSENDFHLHSAYEGCDTDDSYDLGDPGFDTQCAPDERAHSGFRSLHMGRHLNATDTTFDTYRMRQTSAFVMDPVSLGPDASLEFWHIMRVCDDRCNNAGEGGTFAGGQIHISVLNAGTGFYGLWERLSASQNAYGSVDQSVVVVCEFDPGDDGPLAGILTMCGGEPQWSEQGDVYGNDVTCTADTDSSTNPNFDCGQTTNRTHDSSCSWVADATCGSFIENGSVGSGVWARTQFDLSPFAGRVARLRWIFQGGGGWTFGESRSFLEPQPGGPSPSFYYQYDAGWYIDDIKVSDVRVAAAIVIPDPVDGLFQCPAQGDTGNCGVVNVNITGAATDARNGGLVLFAQNDNTGTPITLDARQSVGADDPNTGGTTEGACTSGILEFRWTNLGTGEILKPWGPGGVAEASPVLDTTYRVEARCSSDRSCMASADVEVMTYPGDGRDLTPSFYVIPPDDDPNTDDDGSQVADGLYGLDVSDCDPNNNVTLSWRARPQTAGNNGYDLFECLATGSGVCMTGTGTVNPEFAGSCATADIPQGAVGDLMTTTRACPAAGTMAIWGLGHSTTAASGKGALGLEPLGGSVILSSATCP